MDSKKKNELTIFEQWRDTQDKKHFQELYNSMKPLIHDAARKASYGSNIPESAHRVYAAQAFLDSLRTFKPSTGASLQTHIFGSIHNKVKRLNYEYQNIGKMPEPRAVLVGKFQSEFENMKSSLGREPSSAEMADHMNIPMKQIVHLQKEIRKDLAMESGTEEVSFEEGSVEDEYANYIYYELNPEEKVVYEYITGKFGKPRLVKVNNTIDFKRIAERMGISESKARSLHSGIRTKFKKVLK